MIAYENDVLTIPKKYKKMSVSELEREKARLLKEIKASVFLDTKRRVAILSFLYDRSLHGNRRSIILIFEAIPLTSNIVILLIILA